MITEGDKRNIEAIKSHLGKLITLYIRNGKHSVDWEKASWIDTLETIVYNLENSVHYFKPASLEDVDNNFYTCECKCGWWGSSKFLIGGGQIADTGDYDDCTCPICGSNDIYDKL